MTQRVTIYTAKALTSEQLISRLNYEYGTEIEWEARPLPSGEETPHFFFWPVPPDWDGNDITITCRLKSPVNTGNVRLEAKHAVIQDGNIRSAEALIAFDALTTQAVPATANEDFEISFTDTPGGTTGDILCFRIHRNGSHASDTAGQVDLMEVLVDHESTFSGGGGGGEANTISSVGTGAAVAYGKAGVDLRTVSLKAGTNITLDTSVPEEIEINAASTGEANTASNVGGATEVFKQKTVADLEFRTLTTTTPNVVLTQNASTVAIDAGITDTTTVSATGAVTGTQVKNKLVLGDTSGGAVDITLPSLTASDDNTQFSVAREGGSLLRLLTPSVSYYIKYPGYVNDQILEFPSDGDSATLLYKHATQTYYVVG